MVECDSPASEEMWRDHEQGMSSGVLLISSAMFPNECGRELHNEGGMR